MRPITQSPEINVCIKLSARPYVLGKPTSFDSARPFCWDPERCGLRMRCHGQDKHTRRKYMYIYFKLPVRSVIIFPVLNQVTGTRFPLSPCFPSFLPSLRLGPNHMRKHSRLPSTPLRRIHIRHNLHNRPRKLLPRVKKVIDDGEHQHTKRHQHRVIHRIRRHRHSCREEREDKNDDPETHREHIHRDPKHPGEVERPPD